MECEKFLPALQELLRVRKQIQRHHEDRELEYEDTPMGRTWTIPFGPPGHHELPIHNDDPGWERAHNQGLHVGWDGKNFSIGGRELRG